MKLTIDMETRSTVDLIKCGQHVYAEHESTDILCLAFQVDNRDPVLWIPEKFRYLLWHGAPAVVWDWELAMQLVRPDPEDTVVDIIEAHNISFEQPMWHHIMHKRYGFPDLPRHKLRCSAAKAASYALPRALGKACEVMGVEHQKSKDGRAIMLKMCKPRNAIKADKEAFPNTWQDMTFWHESPEDFKKLCEYCMQDVRAEHALSESLYDLSPQELKTFQLDQVINSRGITVDLQAIDNLASKVQQRKLELTSKVPVITGGELESVSQVEAMREWVISKGVPMANVQAETINDTLKLPNLPEVVRQVLEIRQSVGKTSVTKLTAMKKWACKDNRVRGSMLFNGASTGRWAGKGIQPHNYPRKSFNAAVIECLLRLQDPTMIYTFFGCAIQSVSSCLRGMICAALGKVLFCADFSSIEAIVLAYLAGEETVLEAFRNGLDLYKVAASNIYNAPYDEVTDDQRKIGKVAVLACGYQGWVNAFQSMAPNYGVHIPNKQSKEIISNWRSANPNIVNYWAGVEDAALKAVRTGKSYAYGAVKFSVRGRFLHCRLPSGRLLSYCDPVIENVRVVFYRCKADECEHTWVTRFGEDHLYCPECKSTDIKYSVRYKDAVAFMGVGKASKWYKQYMYGGKFTENIVQAVANDLLREALNRVEAAGFPVVMHVHDEIVAEMDWDTGKTLTEFEQLVSVVPEWATGCPIRAKGWVGKRYRK